MTAQLYTVERAAQMLDVHPQQVRELIWSGELAFVDVSTGRQRDPNAKRRPRVRVAHDEIEKFIRRRTGGAPSRRGPGRSAA